VTRLLIEHAALLAGAGLAAGAVNAMAGGGTLISFPALLAVGLPPVAANVTSSVGLLSGYAGGAVGYRRELRAQREHFRECLMPCVTGGGIGAVVLLMAPAGSFRVAVPYLVILSCGFLLLQPKLARALARRRFGYGVAAHVGRTGAAAVMAAAIYGSYFGAGLGVLLLGVLGVFLSEDLQQLNGLKSLLSLVVNVVGVTIFAVSGKVAWFAAATLMVAAYAGGLAGSRFARYLQPEVLRYSVAALGIVVAVFLVITG